ncbi:hypothetical protein Q3G72_026611 [Acer saccharum]|nr:hypothetical protein Q3G72_026611 [Acer saccharum]
MVMTWEALGGCHSCEKSGNFCGFNIKNNSIICVENKDPLPISVIIGTSIGCTIFFTLCSTSSCGDIKNISYPFRLKGDPAGCGDRDFELSCQSNKTILEFHSGKYYVSNISYYDRIITVADVNLANGSCGLPQKSLLIYDKYDYNYHIGLFQSIGSYDHFTKANFVRCSSNISDPTYTSLPCLNIGNQPYVYVSYGDNNSIYHIPESCSFNSTVPIRKASADDNPSYETIQKLLQSGFDLKWSVGCKDCIAYISSCDPDQDKCILSNGK